MLYIKYHICIAWELIKANFYTDHAKMKKEDSPQILSHYSLVKSDIFDKYPNLLQAISVLEMEQPGLCFVFQEEKEKNAFHKLKPKHLDITPFPMLLLVSGIFCPVKL